MVTFATSVSEDRARLHSGVPTRTTVPLPRRYATKAGFSGSRPAEACSSAPDTRCCDCSKCVKRPMKPSLREKIPSVSPGFTTSGAAAEVVGAVCSPSAFVSCAGLGAASAVDETSTVRLNASVPNDATRPPPST